MYTRVPFCHWAILSAQSSKSMKLSKFQFDAASRQGWLTQGRLVDPKKLLSSQHDLLDNLAASYCMMEHAWTSHCLDNPSSQSHAGTNSILSGSLLYNFAMGFLSLCSTETESAEAGKSYQQHLVQVHGQHSYSGIWIRFANMHQIWSSSNMMIHVRRFDFLSCLIHAESFLSISGHYEPPKLWLLNLFVRVSWQLPVDLKNITMTSTTPLFRV